MESGNKNRVFEAIRIYRSKDEAAGYFFVALVLFFTALLVFLNLVYEYFSVGSWSYDSIVYNFLQNSRNGFLDAFFKTITVAGNTIPAILITLMLTIILFFALKNKDYLYFAANILGAWVLNEVLKAAIKRPRPVDQRLIDLTNMTKVSKEYGFPSGHSMVIMVTTALLVYFILLYSKKSLTLYISCTLMLILALLIGISRVYLGVHYFTDVIAGWSVGIIWASGSIMLHRLFSFRKKFIHIKS